MKQQPRAKQIQIAPHFADYFRILVKHKLIILAAFSMTFVFTALLVSRTKPVYESSCRLIIDTERDRSPVTGIQVDYISQQIDLATHTEVIISRSVLEAALRQIEKSSTSAPAEPASRPGGFLENSPVKRFLGNVKRNVEHFAAVLLDLPENQRPEPTEADILEGKILALRGSIKVKQVENTHLISISAQSSNPVAARDTANAVANAYILYDSGSRLEGSRKMVEWLSSQVYEMKRNVQDAELDFLKFKQRENIFSFEGKQKLNVNKIEDMNAAYLDARTTRLELEARIEELKRFVERKGASTGIPTFYKDSQFHELYGELLSTEVEYMKISQLYKPKHPEIIRLTSKIEELRRKIASEIQKAIDNAESERTILLARENALQGAMHNFEQDAMNTNRKEVEYAVLEREVSTNKEIYDALLTKIKETDLLFGEVVKPKLRLIEPAFLPGSPIRPNRARNLAMGMLVGLLSGIGLAFLLEYMDRTFHSMEKMERQLDLPVLSEIPLEGKSRAVALFKRRNGAEPYPSVLQLPTHSHFSESFRGLATNLRFSEFNRRKGVYLVTSSSPQEGKTTVTMNLGITLASLGLRTAVIEADLRIPTFAKMLGLHQPSGVTDILVNTFGTEITAGSVGELGFGDIHFLLAVQEKSGKLFYDADGDTFTIQFRSGRISDVNWTTRPDKHRLLYLLEQTGKVGKEQSGVVLEEEQLTRKPLEQIILDLGLLSPQELAGPLRLLIDENIRALQNCRKAHFRFVEGRQSSNGTLRANEAALIDAIGPIDEIFWNGTPYLLHEVNRHLFHYEDKNIWVLPSGKIPPNPVEILMSNRMRALIHLLREQFDIVLLDSPPVANLSDARVLAPMCDGVILVIKAGQTASDVIQRVQKQLLAVQSPIVGTVLNMFNYKKDPYYYGRYYSRRYYKETPKGAVDSDKG